MPSTPALFGNELVIGFRVDNASTHRLVIKIVRDRNGVMRDAMREIVGSIQRIDDPQMATNVNCPALRVLPLPRNRDPEIRIESFQ